MYVYGSTVLWFCRHPHDHRMAASRFAMRFSRKTSLVRMYTHPTLPLSYIDYIYTTTRHRDTN